MNFIFECSIRYLTSESSERVTYRVEHKKIKFISKSRHVIFCLLYKHTDDDDFPKISDHFPKISEDFPNLLRRPDERFRTFSGHFSKLSEDNRRFPRTDDVSIIQQHIWVLFKRLCNYKIWYFHVWNNMLFSRVKIPCLRAKAHLVFHWCLYNKNIAKHITCYLVFRAYCRWLRLTENCEHGLQ